MYVSDAANSRIRRVAPDGTIETVVGDGGGSGLGGAGFAGDGGPADKAKAFSGMGLAVRRRGSSVHLRQRQQPRARRARRGHRDVAGTGPSGFGGDGGHGDARPS